jgi:hypothetical protein
MAARGQRQDHYDVLGVSPEAPDEVVKAAYRALVEEGATTKAPPRRKVPAEEGGPPRANSPTPVAQPSRKRLRWLPGCLASGVSLFVNLSGPAGGEQNLPSLAGLVIGCGLLAWLVYWLAGKIDPVLCSGLSPPFRHSGLGRKA